MTKWLISIENENGAILDTEIVEGLSPKQALINAINNDIIFVEDNDKIRIEIYED